MHESSEIIGADKLLRKSRDRYGSNATQAALHEALLNNPGVTALDASRIIAQLGERLHEFKTISSFKNARIAMIEWAERQGRLVVELRNILLEERVGSGHVATLLFMRLPHYVGTPADFRQWVLDTAEREETAMAQFTEWIAGYRDAVRQGLWSVLWTCHDLGVGLRQKTGEAVSYRTNDEADEEGGQEDEDVEQERPVPAVSCGWESDPVAAELEAQVWREVAYDALKIASCASVPAELKRRARWAARAWKTARLRERDALREAKWHIGLHGLEREIRGDDGASDFIEVDLAEILAPGGNLNAFIIRELPWTDADLERELRRGGPFRASDPLETELVELHMAA